MPSSRTGNHMVLSNVSPELAAYILKDAIAKADWDTIFAARKNYKEDRSKTLQEVLETDGYRSRS